MTLKSPSQAPALAHEMAHETPVESTQGDTPVRATKNGNKENNSIPGKRLRAARENAGLTQEDLGNRLGLEHGAIRISRCECGRHVPDFRIMEKMAAKLGVQSFYLYCVDDDLAEMFLQISSRLGSHWKPFLLAQIQEALTRASATSERGSGDRRKNTGAWLHAERRSHKERRAQTDRRQASRGAE